MDHFLEDVTFNDIQELVNFQDTLKLVLTDNPSQPIGEVTIQKAFQNNNSQIKLKIQASATVDDLVSNTFCSGVISASNFGISHQTYEEDIEQTAGEIVRRSTKIENVKDAQGKNNYRIVQHSQISHKSETSAQHNNLVENLLCESGSFVFEALLAKVGFHQEIIIPWFDRTKIELLNSVRYRPLPDKEITALDGSQAMCYGIEKVIDRKSSQSSETESSSNNSNRIVWHNYYLPDGHLISREQISNTNIKFDRNLNEVASEINIMPALPFNAIVASIPESANSRSASSAATLNLDLNKQINSQDPNINTKEVVQMRSEYQKLHHFHKTSNSTWLNQHPTTMNLLKDLTQHLLIHKPENPVLEMKKYFEI